MDTALEILDSINVWLNRAITHPVKLSDFSSVLEIAFGLGAVMYYLELKQAHDREYRQFVENREAVLQFLQTAFRPGKMQNFLLRNLLTPEFPLGIFGLRRQVVLGDAGHSIICSISALFLLIVAGFFPDWRLPSGVMILIILAIFSFIVSYLVMERLFFPGLQEFRNLLERRHNP